MAKVISRPYNPKSSGLQSHMGVCRHKRNKVGIGLLLQLKRRSIMKKIDIYEELKSNDYPGRGIVIGKSADGKSAVTAYFIMGRSVNSRNRVFIERLTRQSLKTRILSYMHLFACLVTRLSSQTVTKQIRFMNIWKTVRHLNSH